MFTVAAFPFGIAASHGTPVWQSPHHTQFLRQTNIAANCKLLFIFSIFDKIQYEAGLSGERTGCRLIGEYHHNGR
jgi:hypothetical protein